MHESKTCWQIGLVLLSMITLPAFSHNCSEPKFKVKGAPESQQVSIESFSFNSESQRYTFDQLGKANGIKTTPASAEIKLRIQKNGSNCEYTLKDDDGVLLISLAYMTLKNQLGPEGVKKSSVILPKNIQDAFFHGSQILDSAKPPKEYEFMLSDVKQSVRPALIPLSNAVGGRVYTGQLATLGEALGENILYHRFGEDIAYHTYDGKVSCDGKPGTTDTSIVLNDIVSSLKNNFELDSPAIEEGGVIIPSGCDESKRTIVEVPNLISTISAAPFELKTSDGKSSSSTEASSAKAK